jgi:hypothetical protein
LITSGGSYSYPHNIQDIVPDLTLFHSNMGNNIYLSPCSHFHSTFSLVIVEQNG